MGKGVQHCLHDLGSIQEPVGGLPRWIHCSRRLRPAKEQQRTFQRGIADHRLRCREPDHVDQVRGELPRLQPEQRTSLFHVRRQVRRAPVGLPLLCLQDQHASRPQKPETLVQQHLEAVVAPEEVHPLRQSQAEQNVVWQLTSLLHLRDEHVLGAELEVVGEDRQGLTVRGGAGSAGAALQRGPCRRAAFTRVGRRRRAEAAGCDCRSALESLGRWHGRNSDAAPWCTYWSCCRGTLASTASGGCRSARCSVTWGPRGSANGWCLSTTVGHRFGKLRKSLR
mmetsp:Transcript_79290/g.236235  ORF Transcript_79290/g.236235 Transcript_79290/m.236235 type:complete len:281 (-) Transcript_79290:471-1313(-)